MPVDLDDEIARLEKQADSLRAEVKLQATSLLSNGSAVERLLAAENAAGGSSSSKAAGAARAEKLRERQRSQAAHNQRNLYRACAGVTTFKVRDPDPNAVDGGAVLGIRIEVARSARFLRPYYVLLNRPWTAAATPSGGGDQEQGSSSAGRRFLRVHRHTLPPAIPVSGLAARHLPAPSSPSGSAVAAERQDLGTFVRRLRREVVRYHHRLGAIADLRAAAGLDGNRDGGAVDADPAAPRPSAAGGGIVDISAADTAATQVKVEWADGRVGRLVMGPGGDVLRAAVSGPRGRDRLTERAMFGPGCSRVEDIVLRLRKSRAADNTRSSGG